MMDEKYNIGEMEMVSEVSQENQVSENESEAEKKDRLSIEEIKELARRIDKSSEEAKYLLPLRLYDNGCYPDGVLQESFVIIDGEAKVIDLGVKDDDECLSITDSLLIPESRNVVVKKVTKILGDPAPKKVIYFVFTPSQGWVLI